MQQIADFMVRSQSDLFEPISFIDRKISAVKWRLWHGRVNRAIRDLERLLERLKPSLQNGVFPLARLYNLSSKLLTYIRSNRGAIVNYDSATEAGFVSPPPSPSQR